MVKHFFQPVHHFGPRTKTIVLLLLRGFGSTRRFAKQTQPLHFFFDFCLNVEVVTNKRKKKIINKKKIKKLFFSKVEMADSQAAVAATPSKYVCFCLDFFFFFFF